MASARPLCRNVAFKSETNVPLLERRTPVPNECSDHVFKVPYKFVATFLIRRNSDYEEQILREGLVANASRRKETYLANHV
jgi:hypothetical protein